MQAQMSESEIRAFIRAGLTPKSLAEARQQGIIRQFAMQQGATPEQIRELVRRWFD